MALSSQSQVASASAGSGVSNQYSLSDLKDVTGFLLSPLCVKAQQTKPNSGSIPTFDPMRCIPATPPKL